ncbi:hypothetical protein PVK06_036323 [Gossypium arboreum]|uniref:Cytochrome P450 71A1-like n=1 Tax=Gossypium arboreum TaxID=29729 RepID=A0ABR0NKD9_GOSAR|nr:hypothetical protein PVK06_036323 [Gossypium arboreum]
MAELLKHPNAMKKVQEKVKNVVRNKIKVDAEDKDPKWWENPEEFIPERFENSSIDFKGQDFQLNPFGFEKRRCPGIAFGVASIEFVMANLLYWFDWKLPAGETTENMDIAELYGLTVIKKTPLHV